MKAMPTDDDCYGTASIRADGRFACPVMLFQCKTPQESSMPWDVYKVVDTTPADQAWHPMDGACSLTRT